MIRLMRTRTIDVATQQRSQMIEITDQVRRWVDQSGVKQGVVSVFVPHTTAGVTINENADPDVVHDMLAQLDAMAPWQQPFYRHGEGNSAAHVKASMMGSSVTVPLAQGRLALGRWQGIFLCEFDGPRTRQAIIMVEGRGGPD